MKTIVSVDGTKPDVEFARRFGLRYVHLPHGYDGIPFGVGQQLAKAAATFPGPIYIHCHHGKHRGPAAAAVMCEATEGWSPAQAIDWMKMAGTAPAYAGLYEAAEHFHPPTRAESIALPGHFPEVAEVSPLVDAMVAIDALWDRLKPLDSDFPTAASDSTLLWEHFRELRRTMSRDQCSTDFLEKLARAESAVQALRSAFTASAHLELAAKVEAVTDCCTDCHKAHRDPAKVQPQ